MMINKTSPPLTYHSLGPCNQCCGGRGPHMGPLRTGWAAGWFWWSSAVLYHSWMSMSSTGTSWTTHSPLEEESRRWEKNINHYFQVSITLTFCASSSKAAYMQRTVSSELYRSSHHNTVLKEILQFFFFKRFYETSEVTLSRHNSNRKKEKKLDK